MADDAFDYLEDETSQDDQEGQNVDETLEEEENDGLSDSQRAAMEQGWRPKEEWEGDPDKWIDAPEFLYRGELMHSISLKNKLLAKSEKKLEAMEKTIKQLAEHNKKIAELEHKKALNELKAERLIAMEENDHTALLEIEERMDELKNSPPEAIEVDFDEENEDVQAQPEFSPEDTSALQTWASKNRWYSESRAMKTVADSYGDEFLDKNPGDIQGMLKYVDQQIRKEFPHKFKKLPVGASVTGTSGRGKSKMQVNKRNNKFSYKDLSKEQQGIADSFVASGVYTDAQEYVDQLAELGEIPAQLGE